MRFKKILLPFLFLVVSFAEANQSLRILNPDNLQGYEGSIKEVEVRCRPLGVYMQVDLYLTFAAGEFPTWFYGEEEQLEIVYEFELPEEAISTESWLWIDGDIVPAKIKDLRTAVTEYEGQIQRKKDPSILTKKTKKEYELRVYPLMAKQGATREVKISYLAPVKWTGKNVSFTFPSGFLPSSDPIDSISVLMYTEEGWVDPLINYNSGLIYEDGAFVNKGSYKKVELTGNDLQNGLTVSYPNPAKNGVYLNRYRTSEDLGCYEMAIIPSLFITENLNREVVFACDFDPSLGESATDFGKRLKSALKTNLNDNDHFNVVFSSSVVEPGWTTGSLNDIEGFFVGLDTNLFYDLDLKQTLITSGDYVGSESVLKPEIIIVSNRTGINDLSKSNALFNGVKGSVGTAKVSVLNLSDGGSKFWVDGIQYQGNECFYKLISEHTSGTNIKGDNLSIAVQKVFSNVSNLVEGFNVGTSVDFGGFTHMKNVVNQKTVQPFDEAYMEVGKYYKDSTFEIKVLIENKGVISDFFSFNIDDVITSTPNDSMVRKMWAGQYVYELQNGPDKDKESTIHEIVSVSKEEQLLTIHTAFLALPPEDTDTIVCLHCKDEITTGFRDKEDKAVVSLHPSPATDLIHFVFGDKTFDPILLKIIDMKGRIVFEGSVWDDNSLDVSFLDSGIYQCVVYGAEEQHSIRLIKK